MDKVLVTGCAGFIGSHLCEELLRRGYAVRGIDNFDPYYPKEQKKKNLSHFIKNRGFEFVEGSILDEKLIRKSVADVSIVYHLAAIAGVRNSLIEPLKYFELDVMGTARMLEACKESGVGKFVFGSSSSVYGEVPEAELPVKESRRLQPISPYALAKQQAEQLCGIYTRVYGLPTACIRYFTVYGPRQRPDEAFTKFIAKAFAGETIEIYGDGRQTRDFTFVDDIVAGTILAAERGDGIYNIGSGKRITVNEMVAMLKKLSGIDLRLKHVDRQTGDVTHTWSDISLAKKELGYSPKTKLEDGIKKQIEWYKSEVLPGSKI